MSNTDRSARSGSASLFVSDKQHINHHKDISIPVEANTSQVQRAAEELIASKMRLNIGIKAISTDIDNMYKMSSEFRKDTRKLEKGADALPVLEDWVQEKVSTIEQLKSQIIFLHKVMDED